MSRARTSFAAPVILAASALALGACSSTPSAGSKQHGHHHPPASTTTSSTTTSSTTTTTTTSPPATTAIGKCQTSGLRVTVVGSQGAAGTQEMTFGLTDTASACTTYGYPGMLLLGTANAPLPTTVDRGGTFAFENVPPSNVQLAPGQTAYFNVGFSDVQSASTTCSSAAKVDVTPPTNTSSATVTASIRACDNGTLHVSAVFSSTNAAATQTTA